MGEKLLVVALAGVAQASFAWPMKHFRGWRWEQVWIGQALTSNIVLPLLWMLLLPPLFRTHIAAVPNHRLLLLVGMGVAWGLGGVGYGISLALLGLSFTYSLLFSITTLAGALLPLFVPGAKQPPHPWSFGVGLALCVAGAIALALAGGRRQVEANSPASIDLAMPVPHLRYRWALLIAAVAGVFSASMGLALTLNGDLVDATLGAGISPVSAALIVWLPLYAGSAGVALAYGFFCSRRARSTSLFWRASPLRNWGLAYAMGLLGCGGVLLYGLGATGSGHPPRNVAWALYMAFFILTGNSIGVFTREWRGCSRRTYATLVSGVTILLMAIGFLAQSA